MNKTGKTHKNKKHKRPTNASTKAHINKQSNKRTSEQTNKQTHHTSHTCIVDVSVRVFL